MNISMQLAVVAAVCLCLAEGAPDVRVARAKQQRPTRGFKNVEMMTARGFGKRDRPSSRAEHCDIVERKKKQGFNLDSPRFTQKRYKSRREHIPQFLYNGFMALGRGFDKRNENKDFEKDYDMSTKLMSFQPYDENPRISIGYGKRDKSDTEYNVNKRQTFRPTETSTRIAHGYGKRDEGQTDYDMINKRQTFKPMDTSTRIALGYGKRDEHQTDYDAIDKRQTFQPMDTSTRIALGYGKRDDHQTDYEVIDKRQTFQPMDTSTRIALGYGKRDERRTVTTSYPEYERSGPAYFPRNYRKSVDNDKDGKVYGLDNFWEMLEASPEREGLDTNDEKALESIPLDWFVNEMLNNPDFTRSVVRKFVDLNQDGQLTSDELLRNVV